jgi:hypothetical protein
MRRPSAAQFEAARHLFALEAREADSAEERAAAGRRVYEKLFERLSPFIGVVGARALFARSARLTAGDFPCLRDVDFDAQPTESVALLLVGCLRGEAPAAIAEATVAVYATMLALLATLIGERLTFQVLRNAWPNLDAIHEEKQA